MKFLLADPVVLICSGIILIGLIALVWAIRKYRRLMPVMTAESANSDRTPALPNRGDLGLDALSILSPAMAPPGAAVSRDVADRLESMTQRLAEMQTLLLKQGIAAPGEHGAAAGGIGQGFSPETIDKLLKIIGNVIQQVDLLQKNVRPSKEGSAETPTAPPLMKL